MVKKESILDIIISFQSIWGVMGKLIVLTCFAFNIRLFWESCGTSNICNKKLDLAKCNNHNKKVGGG